MNLEKYIAKALENIKECINCINFYFPEIFAKIEETREKFSGFEAQEIETCTKNELNDKEPFIYKWRNDLGKGSMILWLTCTPS